MKQISVPGKLILCGEYAVLEPGSLALVAAINRHLHIRFEPAKQWTLSSPHWGAEPLVWGQENTGDPGPFVRTALEMGLAYLEATGTQVPPQALTFSSELEGAQKYGLGSSAAVTVAVLAVLFTAQGQDISESEVRARLLRLALYVHRRAQGSGSGADIAAAVSGGVAAYRSFDGPWLDTYAQPLPTLVDEAVWPFLACQTLVWPQAWSLAVGWTGRPASTHAWVQEFLQLKVQEPERFQQFLAASNHCALQAQTALMSDNLAVFQTALLRVRAALQTMSEPFAQAMETPALKTLADLASSYGFAGKFSGAGGGDCGFAVGLPSGQAALEQAWQQAGIAPLPLAIAEQGVTLCVV